MPMSHENIFHSLITFVKKRTHTLVLVNNISLEYIYIYIYRLVSVLSWTHEHFVPGDNPLTSSRSENLQNSKSERPIYMKIYCYTKVYCYSTRCYIAFLSYCIKRYCGHFQLTFTMNVNC